MNKELVQVLVAAACLVALVATTALLMKFDRTTREVTSQILIPLFVFGPVLMLWLPKQIAWFFWLFGIAGVFIGFCFTGDMGDDRGMFYEPLVMLTSIWNTLVGMLSIRWNRWWKSKCQPQRN